MNIKTRLRVMLITIAVLAVAIIVSAIVLAVKLTGLKGITISPGFADTELDIGTDYIINVNTDPSGVNINKFKFNTDSSSATFSVYDDSTAILHTEAEGAISIWVSKGGVESNYLTFNVVDKAAIAAAEAAAAEAAAEAERLAAEQAAAEAAAAEAEAAAQVAHIRIIKDSVNIRSNASTDGDILGKASKGNVFEVINDNGEWTEFKMSDGSSGFVRNDMIETVAEGEDVSVTSVTPAKEEKKEEEKKEETTQTTNNDTQTTNTDTQQAADPNAQLAEQVQAATQAALEQMQAAAAATPAYAWEFGGMKFTSAEVGVFQGQWGDQWEIYAPHHSAGELKYLCKVKGLSDSQIYPY